MRNGNKVNNDSFLLVVLSNFWGVFCSMVNVITCGTLDPICVCKINPSFKNTHYLANISISPSKVSSKQIYVGQGKPLKAEMKSEAGNSPINRIIWLVDKINLFEYWMICHQNSLIISVMNVHILVQITLVYS